MIQLLLLVGLTTVAFAQQTVRGSVVDSGEAVVPGLTVELSAQNGTTVTAVTNEAGRFFFRGVGEGAYHLHLAAQQSFAVFDTKLTVGRRPVDEVTIHLVVAEVKTEVDAVEEEAGVSTAAESNANQAAADSKALEALPIFDQNVLGALMPFLSQSAIGTSGISIVVDGVEMKGTGVSASALKEVRINNDPYSAETNRPGRGRIEVITKAPGDKVHGTLNFLIRDAALDAKNYFAQVKPQEQKRIFEGSVLGPLYRGSRTGFLISGSRQEDDAQAIVHAVSPAGPIDANVPAPVHETDFAVRLTRDLNANHRVSLQYNVTDVVSRNLGVGGLVTQDAGINSQAREEDVIFNDRLILSPTLINQLQLFYEKDHDPARSVVNARKLVVDGGFTGGGAQADQYTTENNLKINDIVSLSRGKHYVKFGITIPNISRRAWEDHTNRLGTYNFSSLGDYGAGRPTAFTQLQGSGRAVFWLNELGIFVQDQVQIAPRLQAVVGLRYDWQTYFESPHNVSPRGSLAYALKDKKTVIRGGAGMFYDRSGPAPIADLKLLNGVNLRSYTVFQGSYPNAAVPAGYPSNLVRRADDTYIPCTVHYSLALERSIAAGTTLAVSYDGLRGFHLFRSRDVNAPLPPIYGVRPDASVGVLRQMESKGRQISNALEINVQTKAGPWFSGMAQYVLSRTENDTGGIAWFPANQYNLAGEYGRADFDQRHRFEMLGTFHEESWWNLGLGVHVASGLPYTETAGIDLFHTGMLNARPAGVSRNALQAAGAVSVDARWAHDLYFSRGKQSERRHLTFGVEAFNLTNRANFGGYVGNVRSSLFQQPTTAQPARRMQFSLRYKF
ncbi:TonB-dependent receptor [Terriglobus albidus]|uniref:TonB-dependent receptor n=1 Tax=Terriglobus albidus TaxID=1592106 RepID=UPI001FEB3EE4|nr:TonB-dependent receptor [Terriglobus albidus]